MHRLLPVGLACAFVAAAAPNTMIKAEHYEVLKSLLAAGDVVYAFSPRDRDPSFRGSPPPPGESIYPKTFCNEARFTHGMQVLNAIHDDRVEKALVLSSRDDFQTVRARIPKDVRRIMYNSEPGMTPGGELDKIERSVADFARAVHDAGLKFDWAPVGMMSPRQEQRFLALVPRVDAFLLQHQKVLESQGVDAFVDLTKQRAETIRKLNPKCSLTVQVVIGRGSAEDLVAALRRLSGIVDSTAVWTMQDTAGAARILEAVRAK